MKPHTDESEMKSMSHCMNKMTTQGYTANFNVADNLLQHVESGHSYEPDQVNVVDFYRFEGESDPQDNSILYVIETNDGRKGQLVDAYGAYSNPEVDDFIKQVENIKKKKATAENVNP